MSLNGLLTSNKSTACGYQRSAAVACVGAGHGNVGGSSGGGHGGNGGQGQAEPAAGGAHDSFLYPTKFGNNGGHSLFPHLGGIGGGRLYLKVNHTLTVDGFLTALGGDWRSVAAGGGSGGTIHIETYTIDGNGDIDASGGAGYDGTWAPHGGGGGGGRVTLYYMYNFYVGDFLNHGGSGGSSAEPGGPGTVYLHLLPELLSDGSVPLGFSDNRTLYLNNKGYEPRDPYRNLTDLYASYPNASGVAWIWPGSYPPAVTVAQPGVSTIMDVTLDYLKVYEKAQMGMVRPVHTEKIDLNAMYTEGDRTGHVHIGYNQTLFIGTGQLPLDVSLYHGSATTLQGELRVAGVTVMIEGQVDNVENMTIVDGGTLKINYMMDLDFQRIDAISFNSFSIRNRGSLLMNNDEFQHQMTGQNMQIYPGGTLQAKHLSVNVDTLLVDVMGTFNADSLGYCNMEGPGAGYTVQDGAGSSYGTGGSHGGEAGAENSTMTASSAYGNFISPDRFGSAGGDAGTQTGGCGGGILILNANTLLKVDGTLSANGEDGSSNSGGGAGGSIYMTTPEFDGTGTIEVKGGSGRNGGAGGRLGIAYGFINFIGEYYSDGGVGNGGENAAAGTVFTKDTGVNGTKTLKIYNREGEGNRRTRISIPQSKTSDHDIDTLDLGDYAEVGLLATDDDGNPVTGRRDLYLQLVEGDYTATVHVEEGMWLNIDFKDSAMLSFSVAVYPDAQVNLPSDTYLKDVTVYDYGGNITGLETFNISRGGSVKVYPPAITNPHYKPIIYDLNTISILDGGVFSYYGKAEDGDVLEINLAGDLMIRGGGEMYVNKMKLEAVNITIESEGLLSASSGGYLPGGGVGAGIGHTVGSSGGSHGGVGGQGTNADYAGLAHGSVHQPTAYGSGGGVDTSANYGRGGGVLEMTASGYIEIDGEVRADGEDANETAVGGGAGGSILLTSDTFSGTGVISASGGAGACVPYCTNCDSYRRCLSCQAGYSWDNYVCIGYSITAEIAGGGGGGGRFASYVATENTYRGEYQTYGGQGFSESGGSGTVYVKAPEAANGTQVSSLYLDNRNSVPKDIYIDDVLQDSCRTYIITDTGDTNLDMTFDHVYIRGSSHLALREATSSTTDITINMLHGDLSGMIHTSVDQKISLVDSDSPIPASFRVYDTATIQLPPELYFSDLAYTDIYVDGEINGVQNLSLGQGVNFVIGENGYSAGQSKLTFAFDNVQIYTDGKMSSAYVDEFTPSLVIQISNELRLHAGATIEAPWVKVDAIGGLIQIDAASLINASSQAPSSLPQNGVSTDAGGGSGGGNGAAGGQASFQDYVGPPPDYGSIYEPKEFGGNGGTGGGSTSDLRCTFSTTQTGGKGGGVIELAADALHLDGELMVTGSNSAGPRAGGGAGGSVYVQVNTLSGDGTISAQGGSLGADLGIWTTTTAAPTTTSTTTTSATTTSSPSNSSGSVVSDPNCQGGGGAGGRVALHFNDETFSGKITAYGGSGHECGGAGTVLRHDTDNSTNKLTVDNENVCTPINSRVEWTQLTTSHRGQLSFYTWLFDDTTSHQHTFEEVHLSGQAQLALYRVNGQTFTQSITVNKTVGDKSGMWHVGPYQEFSASLPDDSPELQFGMFVYENGIMEAEQILTVTGITIENEGSLKGVENLVIGPNGKIILRPDSSGGVPVITFTSVTVQGGGTLVIETEGNGMKLVGTDFTIQSGGTVEADNLHVEANTLTVEDSAYIKADKLAVHTDGGPGKGVDGRGAGHGGQGGKATNTGAGTYGGGLYYGDISTPASAGSNGIFQDFTNDVEVIGGGILKFDIASTANIDGIISSNGEDGTSLAGGASGGSIILNTVTFNGKGKVTANGGQGLATTGGGAGGRIAISYTDTEFTGSYVAYGGRSTHSTGGAGTVLVDANGKSKLYIDNKEPSTVDDSIQTYDISGVEDYDSGRTWIVFPATGSLTVDQVYLHNGAHVALAPAVNPATALHSFTTEGFYGDGFVNDASKLGTIHVGPSQTFTVRAIDLYFPAHAVVYENGLLEMPSKVKWFNSDSKIYGTIGGLTELTLVQSKLDLKKTSKTQGSTIEGKYTISTINVMAGGVLDMTEDITYRLIVSELYVAPSGVIEGADLLVQTTNAIIEEGGVINLSERGEAIKTGSGYLEHYGSGHSGEGGGYYDSSSQTYLRGLAYDDFKEPSEPGSGSDTAVGGGVLKIEAAGTVEIQGEIKADGGSATSYGGASGGSIWITCSTSKVGGLIHTNGGSSTSSGGGGGGGFIAIYFDYGYVDDRYITSYGGSTTSGETGAAGVIYLQENGNRKVLIKSNEASDALSTMSVLPTAASTQIDTVEIIGPATAGFLTRSTTPALNAQVGRIIGNADSLIRIDQYVDLYWATRVGIVDTLRINTNVHIQHNGKIDLPKTVIIDKGWSLDVCGIVSSNTNEMTVREDGALKISHPASDFQINTLVIDYQGRLEGSDYCDTTSNKVTLKLTYFNTTSGFSLDTSKFSLSALKTGTVSATGSALSQDACPTTANFILNRTQSCTMPTGTNTYTSITVHPGAEIMLNRCSYNNYQC